MVRLGLENGSDTFIQLVVFLNPRSELFMGRVEKLGSKSKHPDFENNEIAAPFMPENRGARGEVRIVIAQADLTVRELDFNILLVSLGQHLPDAMKFSVGKFCHSLGIERHGSFWILQ